MTASEQPFFLNFILSFKFCGDVLLIFFILPLRNLSMPGILQAPKSCPAAHCSYVGPNRALAVHWRVAHEDRSILFLCPLPGCSYQTPRQHNLRTHWERVHGATRPTSAELRTLPLLADFTVNRNRVDPGECRPPVPPLRLPVGSLPHSDKHTLLVRVQVILSGEQPQREPTATQQHPSVSGVVPETPEVFPAEDTSQSGQPDAAPMEAEEQGEASKEGPPVQRPFSPPEGAAGQHTPPHSMSPCTSDSPPVPSPAFTILSSPSLSIDLTTTGSLLASPIFPPCSSPRPERDPVLAQPSPVGPPQVTRSLWDEFTPVTPSRTLPPAVNIPPERRAASATVTSDVPDRDALLAQLREVDGQRLTLDVARSNLIRELAVLEGETLRATRLELEASQQRCQLLEDQLRRYRNTAEPSLRVVGDLQGICSSHALLLLPDRGRTSVYHLTQEDLLSLDISGRDPALSCERL